MNVLECMNRNLEIIAPKLKLWLNYRDKITSAMKDISIREEIKQFLENSSYQIPNKQRKMIINKVYNIADEKHEYWMMPKLKNALSFNREEICNCIRLLIDKREKNSNYNDNNAAKTIKSSSSTSTYFSNGSISNIENSNDENSIPKIDLSNVKEEEEKMILISKKGI